MLSAKLVLSRQRRRTQNLYHRNWREEHVGIEDLMADSSANSQEITVVKDEHGLLFLGDPKEIKA